MPTGQSGLIMHRGVPYAGVHCAFLINEKADNYLKSPELLAKGVAYTAEKYHADGIPLIFDLSNGGKLCGV